MHIPEHQLPVGVKPPGREHPRDMRPSDPDPVQPAARLPAGGCGADHVGQRDLQPVLDRPQPVRPLDVDDQRIPAHLYRRGHPPTFLRLRTIPGNGRHSTTSPGRRPASVLACWSGSCSGCLGWVLPARRAWTRGFPMAYNSVAGGRVS
jgi:hypothetical protein